MDDGAGKSKRVKFAEKSSLPEATGSWKKITMMTDRSRLERLNDELTRSGLLRK
jgi:hypothetical protein